MINPSPEIFAKRYEGGQPQLVWSKISADLFTPVSVMLRLKDKHKYCFLLESVEGGAVRGRYSVIGLGAALLWKSKGSKFEITRGGKKTAEGKTGAMEALKSLINAETLQAEEGLPPMSSGLFGYVSYDFIRQVENIPDKNKDELGIPESLLIKPEALVIFDSVKDEMFIITEVSGGGKAAKAAYEKAKKLITKVEASVTGALKLKKPPKSKGGEIKFNSNFSREEYHRTVEKAKEYIRAGDIFQVVPSQRFTASFKAPPFDFYRSLRHLNPSPFLFYLQFGDFCITGSSPEIMVRVRDGKVTIRPIAGTRRRGKDRREDEELAHDLLSDEKEKAEHLMLLDLGRNDVGRVAKPGTVKVTERMVIENYSHVMHIVSNVEGELADGKDVIDAMMAGFPAGTVSGAPKIRAMEIIDELENTRRGFYGGCVGYFSRSEMDTCIALRTALIKNNKLYLQAGGGVVADSDPEAEYQETMNKAKALMRAAERVNGG